VGLRVGSRVGGEVEGRVRGGFVIRGVGDVGGAVTEGAVRGDGGEVGGAVGGVVIMNGERVGGVGVTAGTTSPVVSKGTRNTACFS
jgi:hypothetical protein